MWPLAQKVLGCAGTETSRIYKGKISVCFPFSLTLFQNIHYSHIIFWIKRIFSVVLQRWISLPNLLECFSAIWKHCVVSTESCQGTQITSWTKCLHCMTFNMNALVISSGPKEGSALSGGQTPGLTKDSSLKHASLAVPSVLIFGSCVPGWLQAKWGWRNPAK